MLNLDTIFHQRTNGSPEDRRRAIEDLIGDRPNREEILEKITEIIKDQSEVLYQYDPKGLEEEETKKYRRIIDSSTAQQGAIQTALGILGPDGVLDSDLVSLVDKSGMLKRLGRWSNHITHMRGQANSAADEFRGLKHKNKINKIKIYGLGGSAAPQEIVAEIVYNSRVTEVEIEVVHADAPNPDHVDKNTLVVCCSFSGNTEETVNCFNTVRGKTDLLVFMTQGGKLGEIAQCNKIPLIQLPYRKEDPSYVLQPRESACLQLTGLFTFFSHLELSPGSKGAFTPDLARDEGLVRLVEEWGKKLGPSVPFGENPAKQLAFFLLYGKKDSKLDKKDLWNTKIPFVLVDRNYRSLGHEVRTQLHERAKINGGFYEAPEFLHNLVESMRADLESANAGQGPDRYVYYFIRSPDEEERIQTRLDKTIELVLGNKSTYAQLTAAGDNPYQRALWTTYFNAYMTTYLAILNGFDPLPVPTMSWLKTVMEEIPRTDGSEESQAGRQFDLNLYCRE